MIWLILGLILFAIAFLIAAAAKKTAQAPYSRKKSLLNAKEQALFHKLQEVMPDYYVMTQIRLADIIEVKATGKDYYLWFNKISRKSVDFVICDKSFAVLCCIELDGKTHEREDRQKADNDKDLALKSAGVPIVRMKSNLPNKDEIKKLLEEAIFQSKNPFN